MVLGDLHLRHVPGHSAGQVVIQIDDVLLSGDHILKTISPHQSPRLFNPHMGLGLFLESLELVRSFADSIQLTLGGHKGPIWDLTARIAAIHRLHKASW
jgi:glyoxylase-like metal-dependent hydrolase (beta-lactamase superfamily II)